MPKQQNEIIAERLENIGEMLGSLARMLPDRADRLALDTIRAELTECVALLRVPSPFSPEPDPLGA